MNTSIISTIEASQEVLNLSAIHDPKLLEATNAYAALNAKIYSGVSSFATSIEAIRREQSAILNTIESNKLYAADGFKSLAEYAETVGIKKSLAHQLARAGAVYADPDAPDELKALSPSNVDTLSAAIKRDKGKVYADAKDGKFTQATQQTLKDYAKEVVQRPEAIAKTYTLHSVQFVAGYIDPDGESKYPANRTIDEWKQWMTSQYDDDNAVVTLVDTLDLDGAKAKRFVLTHNWSATVYFLKPYKPTPDTAKEKAEKKRKAEHAADREAILRQAVTMSMTEPQINAMLGMIRGQEPLADGELDRFISEHKAWFEV